MFKYVTERNKALFTFVFFTAFALVFTVPAVYGFGDLGIMVERLQDEKAIQCPVCGQPISPGVIHTDAAAIVKEKLKIALTDRDIGYADGTKKGQPYIDILIYRFQERKGGNFAVEKPASVAFHMHLMKDGVVGRVFAYSEEQKALTQNILTMGKFLKRGAKWVTADELAEEGINAGLNQLVVEPKGTPGTDQ
ncbi:MAG: hypothetical protein PHT96_01725 [Syntrophorhabdaceae bacterium]|nr:hypothetical protein [Syntrophorhabdaceae bacterium]MDD4195117.1 hypothetical protein [Syntrophorhabdaceae bacterium]HOC46034.1 hypothetical protein [Syntrophorhabdaceae bacterium]